MTTDDIKRRLAAILSADASEYSRLMREDETETVRTLTDYREIMTTLIQQHHGRVVDSPGDNLLAEFASVVDAMQGAVAIQKELKARNAEKPDNRKMQFRIGINLGDIIVEGERIYGDGVNIAARLEGMAEPGGICISRTSYDQIEDKLPLGYEYLGEKTVKNIAKPVRAYKVLLEPEEPAYQTEPETGTRRSKRRRRLKKIVIKGHDKRRHRSAGGFYRHLRTYLGVIAFLLIINLLTYKGILWVTWPALGWGLLLFLHWNLRYSASSRRKAVIGATSPTPPDQKAPTRRTGRKPKYLKVKVKPADGKWEKGGVDIRIPLKLLKAGAKLSSVLPTHVKETVNRALRERGFDVDVSSLEGNKLEEFLKSLSELSIVVDEDGKKVRIYCE